MNPKSNEPAEKINSDLDALRELDGSDMRPGWSRQFALILVLVSALVVIAWFSATRTDNSKPLVFNSGVVLSAEARPAAWIALALEQAMVATIETGAQLRLINPVRATTSYATFGLSSTSATRSGAEWFLRAELSAVAAAPETVVVRLSLTRNGQRSPEFSADVFGSVHAISDLATRSIEQLFAWLKLDAPSRQQIGLAQNEIPQADAIEAYGRGLEALSRVDGRAALRHFGAAIKLAPNNATIHEGLANAWELLGYTQNAATESELALAASGQLSRRRQLELEARLALRTETWPRAQQVFAALKEFNPQDLSYRLALADSQARQNDNDGFAESIREMRAMQGVAGDDPRIDLIEAEFWFNSGDYGRCFELARMAELKAVQSGDQHVLGEALMSAGRCDDTYDPAVLLEARRIFQALNTPLRESEILRLLAKHEFAKGNMPQYLSYLEEALAQAQQLGNEPEIANSQNALALAYDLHGWLTLGFKLKQQVAEYQKQRNNMNRYSILLENIGISLFKLGRYDEAVDVIDQASKIFVEIDDKIGIAWLPFRRGQIALRRGNIDAAKKLMTRALENADERPEGGLASEASYELGLINFYAGNYEEATTLLEQANRVFRKKELSASIAESEIALARLNVQSGNDAAAQQNLRNAEGFLTKEVAYYSMSLRSEQTNFGFLKTDADLRRACSRLEEIVERQEFRQYLLRAKAKIVVCLAMVKEQPFAVSHAMLVAVEEEARTLGLFEAQLTAGFVRAALLQRAGRTKQAAAENERVKALAAQHHWQPHPIPDLELNP